MTVATGPPPAPPPGASRTRRHSTGARLGPLPVVNIVVLQVGFAVGLILLAVNTALWWAATLVLLLTAALAFVRRRGRWLVLWLQLGTRYLLRSRESVAPPVPGAPAAAGGDPRLSLLRLVLPDLVVVDGIDHERQPLGLAWHQGIWTAVLQVEPAPSMVNTIGGAPSLPLGALAPCLQDRGVVLEAIQVIWHCYPGSTTLPPASPALSSYLEVLGPLPAAARRSTWVAVRLDPRRCLAAVAERGGGVIGSHRALAGALSRVHSTLQARGVPTRPLSTDELLRAGISAAELSAVTSAGSQVALRERWAEVTAAGVVHASYAITGWPGQGGVHNLDALTGVRALSATVALSISPGERGSEVGLRGVVRISARSPQQLAVADERLHAVSARVGVGLTALHGLQVAGLAATLPLGAAA